MRHYSLEGKLSPTDVPLTYGRARLVDGGFPEHTHDYWELVIVLAGSGLHTAEGHSYPLRAGDVFVIKKGQCHRFNECRDLEMVNIGFDRRIVGDRGMEEIPGMTALVDTEPAVRTSDGFAAKLHLSPVQLEEIVDLLRTIEHERSERRPGCGVVFRSVFERMLVLLARCYSAADFPAGRELTRLTACASLIERNYSSRVDMARLATEHGYSHSRFRREFRRVFGLTPLQYLRRQRLDKATELLRTTERTVSEIGYACGFEDSNYFSRVFRKEMGSAPRNYRKGRSAVGPRVIETTRP